MLCYGVLHKLAFSLRSNQHPWVASSVKAIQEHSEVGSTIIRDLVAEHQPILKQFREVMHDRQNRDFKWNEIIPSPEEKIIVYFYWLSFSFSPRCSNERLSDVHEQQHFYKPVYVSNECDWLINRKLRRMQTPVMMVTMGRITLPIKQPLCDGSGQSPSQMIVWRSLHRH